jgi:High-temperature-induced dauer-formation protein
LKAALGLPTEDTSFRVLERMGNTGSAEFAEAASRLKASPLTTPEDLQEAFAKLIPEKRELRQTDIWGAISPDDVRYLRNKHPRNLACLLIEAIGILADQAGEPNTEKICSTINAARLLTRVLPIVFEEPDHPDDFVSKVFWEQCLPLRPKRKKIVKKPAGAAPSAESAEQKANKPEDEKSNTEATTAADANGAEAVSSAEGKPQAQAASEAQQSSNEQQQEEQGEVEIQTTYLYERIRGADER